jgi:hypothetical protein
MTLKYVTRRLQDDKKAVLQAVQACPAAIAFASVRLHKDYDVVMTALHACHKDDFSQVYSIVGDCKASREMVQTALDAWPHVLLTLQCSRTITLTREQVLSAVERDVGIYANLLSEYKADFDLAYAAMSQDRNMYAHVPNNMKYDARILQLC